MHFIIKFKQSHIILLQKKIFNRIKLKLSLINKITEEEKIACSFLKPLLIDWLIPEVFAQCILVLSLRWCKCSFRLKTEYLHSLLIICHNVLLWVARVESVIYP